jgi:hypothetical protein
LKEVCDELAQGFGGEADAFFWWGVVAHDGLSLSSWDSGVNTGSGGGVSRRWVAGTARAFPGRHF